MGPSTPDRGLWGSGFCGELLGTAETGAGSCWGWKAGCGPRFPRTKVRRIPGWGFQRPFSDFKPAPRSRVGRFGQEGFGQEMRRLLRKHRSLQVVPWGPCLSKVKVIFHPIAVSALRSSWDLPGGAEDKAGYQLWESWYPQAFPPPGFFLTQL